MDIAINEQNQERIRRKVESGKYSSVDDVLANALALLDERDDDLESELADMHEKVRIGWRSRRLAWRSLQAKSSMSFGGRNAEVVHERR